ncbi:hypothetical protein [Halomonas saccharevitans]|uniref:Uncharacterized protein n=1 Tax=Halomonas saccharevitans TaxID=416872 RepID=A0A1I6ZNW8_9GAMM|nr:hypothetical protein [Halomonas saccharevitans]SFT64311.1 hypothetical protein SAMN04487956_11248 [Halomonas saccharevitans]
MLKLKRLFHRPPVKVWVIKQIDRDLLHLCGQAELDPKAKRKQVLAELARGEYRGAVRMAGGGLVFNARLFAALIPLDELTLTDDGQARWRERLWRVSQVPQRCWSFEGSLIAEPASHVGGSGLVSSEDVSGIRSRIDPDTPTLPGEVTFRAEDELEAPEPFDSRYATRSLKRRGRHH